MLLWFYAPEDSPGLSRDGPEVVLLNNIIRNEQKQPPDGEEINSLSPA